MTIRELALEINKSLDGHSMAHFQDLRKTIKNLERKKTRKIFSNKTIRDKWAFHDGGRHEIQFNIGFVNEGIRYGLAFSLEPSQTLPNPLTLRNKIERLNILFEENPNLFANYSLWYELNDKKIAISDKQRLIPPDAIALKSFIFLGKIANINDISAEDILNTFDEMLPIYEIIEGERDNIATTSEGISQSFIFQPSQRSLPTRYRCVTHSQTRYIESLHTKIQQCLIERLKNDYGENNVSYENSITNKRIDVAVRANDGFYFYEVKVASSLSKVIRDSIGQLLEYAYSDAKENARKLFIVSNYGLDERNSRYLAFLREHFKLPIEYLQISP